MWWLVIASERMEKQGLVAKSLHTGLGPALSTVCVNDPPVPTDPFIACGQLWVVERIVPRAIADKQPFWLVDNGYYKSSGRGQGLTGHFEFTYRGLTPIVMEKPDFTRFPAATHLRPWRKERPKGYVLIGYPGPTFGQMIGLDMRKWMDGIIARVQAHTNRPILLRHKGCSRLLEADLAGAHCVVTHSSNVAIDAVRMGVPAIVADTNPASPVCSTDLADIEKPYMPDRRWWWASLMCQQYTVDEMKNGTAWRFMRQIMEQVDG